MDLQALVSHLASLESLRLSSIIRDEGHHKDGRAFDIGNEDIAKTMLPKIATDSQVSAWKIDEIIFDAKKADATFDRNKWNYDQGVKHVYDTGTLAAHGNHIHFAVAAPARIREPRTIQMHRVVTGSQLQGAALPPSQRPSLQVIDFRCYPDNCVLPQRFSIAEFEFESLGGRLMANDIKGDRGLQFSDLRVVLRQPVDDLLLEAGGFAGIVTLSAFAASGSQVRQVDLPTNDLVRLQLTGAGIQALEFKGGNGEGILVEMILAT